MGRLAAAQSVTRRRSWSWRWAACRRTQRCKVPRSAGAAASACAASARATAAPTAASASATTRRAPTAARTAAVSVVVANATPAGRVGSAPVPPPPRPA